MCKGLRRLAGRFHSWMSKWCNLPWPSNKFHLIISQNMDRRHMTALPLLLQKFEIHNLELFLRLQNGPLFVHQYWNSLTTNRLFISRSPNTLLSAFTSDLHSFQQKRKGLRWETPTIDFKTSSSKLGDSHPPKTNWSYAATTTKNTRETGANNFKVSNSQVKSSKFA